MESKGSTMENSKTMTWNAKKIGRILFLCVLAILFFIFNLYSMNELTLNSDMANMVLEAEDILNGNFFLREWNLTGISFLTTDLLYFIFGVAICGVSSKAYILAVASMFFMLVLASCFLLGNEHRGLGAVILLGISCFPNAYYKSSLCVHTACFAWCFWSLFFFSVYLKNKRKVCFFLSVACLTLATCGDSISILLMVFPLIVISLWDIFAREETDIWRDKQQLILAGASLIMGVTIEKIYLMIGGANKNAYIGSTHFAEFSELPEKVGLFFGSLFRLMDADYTAKPISDITALISLGRAAVVVIGLLISITWIVAFIKSKNVDYISVVLSIGFWSVALVYMLTDLSISAATARYYVFGPCLLGIIAARYISLKIVKRRQIVLLSTLAFAVFFMAVFPIGDFRTDKTDEGYGMIINVLEENNLENGYSTFWTSSVLSVASEGKVTVRHIRQDEEGIHRMDYFSKNSWYDTYANFIIINPREEPLNKDILINILGDPIKDINAEGYEILVFDHDIHLGLTELQ